MVKKQRESEILKDIKTRLPWKVPEVVWVDRLASGAVNIGNTHMRLCQKGTPDLYAIMRHGGGHVLFIECKAPGGRQSDDQKVFQFKICGMENVHYVLAYSIQDVLNYIKLNIKKEV